jgi:hypothetical protein
LLAEMTCPMTPDILSSFVVYISLDKGEHTKTSIVPLKPIFRYPASSLTNVLRKLCLKMAVMKESEMIMKPFVALVRDFISSRPT